ncbi:MAG: NAD(P)H-hydrate epimerase, partial [Bacillota bacterium]
MLLVSAQQMRELDDKVQKMGVPALILMENAGKALAYHSMIRLEEKRSSHAPESAGSLRHKGSIAILAGPGQNGGDGFCAARHLASWGYQVKVGFFGDEKRLPREASL